MLTNDKIKEIANLNRMAVQQLAESNENITSTLNTIQANVLLHSYTEIDGLNHHVQALQQETDAQKIKLATLLKQQEILIKKLMAEIETQIIKR